MADYIIEPLDTDAEEIFQGFVDYIQVTFPDWQPSEGQLDVIIGRYFAMQTAFTADMASRVLRAIYRYFGNSLANIPPLPGSAAIAHIHFDILDPLDPPVDRVLPFGTLIGLTDLDGDIQMFALLDDMLIDAGTTSGEVEAQAIELGSASNGISGAVELIEQVDWITAAEVIGFSTGGSNPEDDEVYIQRLTENLALMAPRPILAEDFATFAKNIPGIWRAAVIDNFRPGALEKQSITHGKTGGTFMVQWPEVSTEWSDPIPWNANVTEFRDGLLSTPGSAGNYSVYDFRITGGPLPTPIVVEFIGRFGYKDVAPMVIDGAALTGPGAAPTVTTVTAGAAYGTDLENSIAISAIDELGNPISDETRDILIAYLESTRSQNFIVTYVDPAYWMVDVEVTVRALRYQDPRSVASLVESALTNFTRSDRWGVYPYESNQRTWILQPTVRYLELTTVVENTPGVDYIEDLAFSVGNTALDDTDKDFQTAFSLTVPGGMTCTVNLPT